MDSLSLQGQTLLKTRPIASHSVGYLNDRKKHLALIAQPKGIYVYNLESNKFQDEIKLSDKLGSISCLTISDDLAFFACGMCVCAAGSNGKVIFEFDTYIAADRIDIVLVSGYRLWVMSGDLVNEFALAGAQLNNKKSRKGVSPNQRTEDAHSHVFESKINSAVVIEEELEKPFLMILKNSNQIIGYDTKELCCLKTNSPPVALCQYKASNQYIIGLMSGEILYVEASRKEIKQIWNIKEGSSGRINCIIRGKNDNFIVFRDDSMDIWGPDRSILGTQEMSEKILSAQYVDEKEVVICGSSSGNITQMNDYLQMMKNYQSKNQVKAREVLEREIEDLKKQLQSLKGRATQASKRNLVSQGISVQARISIDYTNLCCCLELNTEQKITKIIIKGELTLLKSPKVVFEGKEDNVCTYVLEEESTHSCKVPFKVEEAYHENLKMRVIVYGMKDGDKYAITKVLDIKPMSLHHKIGKSSLGQHNGLTISGPFKYFQANMWLNSIFLDFGGTGDSGQVFQDAFYQSMLTKQKIWVRYKNSECEIKAENPAALIVIRKMMIQKSQQKHISLNFSTQLSLDSVKNMVASLGISVRPILELKKKSQLLPGLMELRNDPTLSKQFKQILSQSAEIEARMKSCTGQHQALLDQIRSCFTAYRTLKDRDVNKFQMDSLERAMADFDESKICSLILE